MVQLFDFFISNISMLITRANFNCKWLSPLGRCGGGVVFVDHESSNRIEIAQLVQDLFYFQ